MNDRIQTNKVLNNGYFNGNNAEDIKNSKIAVSPLVSDNYQESVTEDIVQLNDRKDTEEKIYEIFKSSPYAKEYMKDNSIKKIAKKDIFSLFYYIKERLEKVKPLSAYEFVIAVNEFFDFSYTYIVSKVLSPKMKSEIYKDYYNNLGMKNRMDKIASVKLF